VHIGGNAVSKGIRTLTTRANDSREGATINVVANYFHAELSDPNAQSRTEILSTIRELSMASQPPKPGHLPDFFLKDDGGGDKFPAMKIRKDRDEDAAPEVAKPVEVQKSAAVSKVAQPEFDLIRL
jgi:hypothetical protein